VGINIYLKDFFDKFIQLVDINKILKLRGNGKLPRNTCAFTP